jgi:hypothetical protein
MSVKDRLRRLERGAESCPECRHKPEVAYVYYPDEGDPVPDPEHCPECGRALGFVIRVVYEEDRFLAKDLSLGEGA